MMSVETMTPEPNSAAKTEPVASTTGSNPNSQNTSNLDPQIQAIIDKARAASVSSRGAWMLSAGTAVLLWASFTPLNWSPLAWIALAPLMLLIRPVTRTRWTYLATYTTAFVGQIATLQWMRLGDPMMYIAMVALAAYIAAYFPFFIMLSRTAVHRLNIPFALAVPCVWVGLEYMRSFLMTGFPWYYLGHTQYRWTSLIQISDLTGTYGISFVMACAAAALTMLIPSSLFQKLKMLPAVVTREQNNEIDSENLASSSLLMPTRPVLMTAASLGLFAAVLGYGFFRLSETTFEPGPRIALVQGNFTSSLKHDPAEAQNIFDMHYYLTGQTVPFQPDLIVWPESMYRYPVLQADSKLTTDELIRLAPAIPPDRWNDTFVADLLGKLSAQSGAAMMIGVDSRRADATRVHGFNSAMCITPEGGVQGMYDKNHRVMFGEYIPFQDSLLADNMVSPTTGGMGIDAGQGPYYFEHDQWNFAPLICYEDTVSTLVRDYVKQAVTEEKPVDCLVNLTNDGWFHGSSELDQHLITAAFRCVETRTPMVRAVNTGISAIIDSEGVIRNHPDVFLTAKRNGRRMETERRESLIDPKTGTWVKQVNGIVVDQVPLDSRVSPYVRFGDWFATICLLFVALCFTVALWPKPKQATPATI